MNKYIIHGGRPLMGEVTISGAKNAAVAIIPAALLVDGVCRIENIPQISDVTLLFSILEELGARVRAVLRRTESREENSDYQLGALFVSPKRHVVKVDGEEGAGSGPAITCWARCWAASARLLWPCLAAAISASGPSTSTSRASGPWARRSPRATWSRPWPRAAA